jgi:hypothetical protein
MAIAFLPAGKSRTIIKVIEDSFRPLLGAKLTRDPRADRRRGYQEPNRDDKL